MKRIKKDKSVFYFVQCKKIFHSIIKLMTSFNSSCTDHSLLFISLTTNKKNKKIINVHSIVKKKKKKCQKVKN